MTSIEEARFMADRAGAVLTAVVQQGKCKFDRAAHFNVYTLTLTAGDLALIQEALRRAALATEQQ